MPKVLHPHVTSNPAICGGSMCIAGTRIAVRTIAIAALRYGQTPEEILAQYPHLTLASIHDALSCYYDNREEIDKEIAEFEALDPGLHSHWSTDDVCHSVKLYLDESVSVALATILAQHGIDCLTVRDAGHLGQSDEFQLRVATETERTMFTHDTRDFIALATRWHAAGRHHSGILLCHFMPLRQLARRFQIFLLQPPPTTFEDQIIWLPPAWSLVHYVPSELSSRSSVHLLNHLAQGADGVGPVVTCETSDSVDPHLALDAWKPRDSFRVDKLLLAEYHQAQLLHEMLPQIQIDRPILAPLNQETLHQPIVTIMHQPEGTTYPDPFTVNLAAQPDGPQTRAIEVVIER